MRFYNRPVTLRSVMADGWDATGKLKPLWDRLAGQRDQLADLTGILPTVLSGYNSGGRLLGMKNALRIAAAMKAATGADVTVYDLGKPRSSSPVDWDFAMSLLGHAVTEIERRANETPPDLLRAWASELHRLAWTLEEVADARAGGELPS